MFPNIAMRHRLYLLGVLLLASCMPQARASYYASAPTTNYAYSLSHVQIPATVGATTEWQSAGVMGYTIGAGGIGPAYTSLLPGGGLTSDGISYRTSNSGVGVQFKTEDENGCAPSATIPPFNSVLPVDTTCTQSAIRVSYRLIRLADKVPAGKIAMPNLTVSFYNPMGTPVTSFGSIFYSGATDQPEITPCQINLPAQVSLDDLQAGEIKDGAQKMKHVDISLNQCPGAIDNISYFFTSPYGPEDTVYGTINTRPGSAAGIYFQLLRGENDPYQITASYPLDGYDGSGNYTIPFNVAYYVNNPDHVQLGDLESVVSLVVNYQ